MHNDKPTWVLKHHLVILEQSEVEEGSMSARAGR